MHPQRWLRVLAVAMATTVPAAGCRSEDATVAQEPVAECEQYERFISSCFQRDVAFADHPTLIPKTRAERTQIQRLCRDNLQRMQKACR